MSSQSAGISITDYCSLGSLNNKHLLLTVLEAEKVLADLVLGEGHLFIMSLHSKEQKEKEALLFLLIRALIPL